MSAAMPQTAWDLSAPETLVLRDGPKASGAEAFKLGVLELVTRGALRLANVEERGMLGRRKRTPVLSEVSGSKVPDSRALRAIWQLYEQQPRKTFADGTAGVAVADMAKAATERYRDLGKYAVEEVWPTLMEQGLYVREEKRILWIFPSTTYRLSPEGEALLADLQARSELAEHEFGGWVQGDPTRAMAFAGLAGASLLLMPVIYPDLQLLGERQRQAQAYSGDSGTSGGAGGYGSDNDRELPKGQEASDVDAGSPDASSGNVAGFDVGSLNIGGLDWSSLSSLDFGAFDSIDAAFSAIDSGVDSGGGSDGGGGDGGGGDGGGGGGD